MLKCFKFLFLNLILLQLFSSSTQSQTIEPKFDQLTITIPNCVVQDINGFIWIGAQEGLIRYDGYELKKYRNIPFDTTSLSANWVTALAEDKYGNLWVGTIEGLNYFDRITEQFTHFLLQPKDTSIISRNAISKIVVNEDGSLWIGTSDCGLFYAKKKNHRDLDYTQHNLESVFDVRNPEKKIWIWDIYDDHTGNLWIGTDHGLLKFKQSNGEIIQFKHDPNDPKSLKHNTVRTISPDNLGHIWLGTGSEFTNSGGGLHIFNLQSEKFIQFPKNFENPYNIFSNRVFPVFIDSKDILWIGSLNQGIISFPFTELLKNQQPNFNLAQRHKLYGVQSIYEDHFQNLWFTRFFGRKLFKYDRQQNPFFWYHRVEGSLNTMSSSGIETIFIDRRQNIWFGHNSTRLDKYNPQTGIYKHYLLRPTDSKNVNIGTVCGIEEDENGYLWIATMNDGIYTMDLGRETFKKVIFIYEGGSRKRINSIRLLHMSQSGNLYIGTIAEGLFLFNPHSNVLKSVDFIYPDAENTSVSSLFEDAEGTLWLGTMNFGLYRIQFRDGKTENVQHFVHNPADHNSLSYNQICDVIRPTITDTNAVWIATGNGLNRLDLQTKSYTHFYEKDGIPNDYVLKILEDNQGNIWIACATGIGKYDIITGKWKSFGIGDGMPFETFGGCRQNTAKAEDGQLFFSGSSGTIGFYPEQIKDNLFIPPIRLIDFKIFHESVKLDTTIQFKKQIRLTFAENAFSFEFVALNFTNPEKNQYAYKMEGFIDDWINIGNERKVSFTNLDPGKYVFRVKGSNNHGAWNEEGASIRVIITPPWWQTDWAYFVYTLLLGTLLFGTVRFELQRRQRKLERQLQREQELRKLQEAEHRAIVAELERKTAEARKEAEKEQMRSRIASDLHDEIGSNLSSIALIGQVLLEKVKVSQRMKERLQEIPRIARLTAESMRDIVWFINPENDDWDKFLAKMRETANMMLEIQDFTFNVPEGGITLETDLNFRRNLYLIYKECLQNIIKHSRAQKVEIELRQKDNSLILRVGDDGVGFDTGREYSGNGLKNLRRRAADIGGKLEIISEIGKGTTVTLVV